jgi:TPR repeat protein
MPQAMHALGTAYFTGEGAKKDLAESVRWFSQAAETGLAASCVGLGNVYANGGPGASWFVSDFQSSCGPNNVLFMWAQQCFVYVGPTIFWQYGSILCFGSF